MILFWLSNHSFNPLGLDSPFDVIGTASPSFYWCRDWCLLSPFLTTWHSLVLISIFQFQRHFDQIFGAFLETLARIIVCYFFLRSLINENNKLFLEWSLWHSQFPFQSIEWHRPMICFFLSLIRYMQSTHHLVAAVSQQLCCKTRGDLIVIICLSLTQIACLTSRYVSHVVWPFVFLLSSLAISTLH